MLDVLLINPSLDYFKDQAEVETRRLEEGMPNQESPQLGIAYMLSMARQRGLEFRYLDMVADCLPVQALLDYIEEHNPMIIGFTVYTIKMPTVVAIAKAVKEKFPKVLICCGGSHVSALPRESLRDYPALDFIICGEAEEIMCDTVEYLKNHKTIYDVPGLVTRRGLGVPIKHEIKNLDTLQFPAWGEIGLENYGGSAPHMTNLELPASTSRGCPFRCTFCARNSGDGNRRRSHDSVIAEIHRNCDNFGCEAITFTDETLIVNPKKTQEMFSRFISEGVSDRIKWSCEGRVDRQDADLFRLMAKSGCFAIFFGFESGDDDILKLAKKGTTVKQIKESVKMAKDAGILCFGAFIIGLPGETEKTAQKSIALAEELDCYSVTFPIAVPLPGTELRRMALNGEYGLKVITNDWSLYGKQYPGIMESDELDADDRRILQAEAYARNPKKNYDDYVNNKMYNNKNLIAQDGISTPNIISADDMKFCVERDKRGQSLMNKE